MIQNCESNVRPSIETDQHVTRGEGMCRAVGEAAVEQRTGEEDDSGKDGDPVQLAERASDNVSGEMRVGQNARSEDRRREHERKED